MVEAIFVAGTLGPFLTAFATELGRRFGGTVADWTSKIRVHHKRHVLVKADGKADVEVEAGGAVTVLEIKAYLPDEARLALIDLDISADAVRGHRLKWDGQAGAWVSAD